MNITKDNTDQLNAILNMKVEQSDYSEKVDEVLKCSGFSCSIGSQQTHNFTLLHAHRHLIHYPTALIFFDKIVSVKFHGLSD